jgi:hypothetical protein
LVIPAVLDILWALFCLKYLQEKPSSDEEILKDDHVITNNHSHQPQTNRIPAVYNPTITLLEALRIPNVIFYALAFGLFKFVNYSMFFWLPFYLSQYYGAYRSNLISALYDVGMIPGGILVGIISDMYGGRRACVIATFTIMLLPCLLICAHYSDNNDGSTHPPVTAWFLLSLLGIMGCLIGGPINIITSAVAIDLSEHAMIAGHRNDLMAVTGFINGSGSIMAALGLVVVGPLASAKGWKMVWHLLAISTLLGTLLLSPAIYKEVTRSRRPVWSSNDHDHKPTPPSNQNRNHSSKIIRNEKAVQMISQTLERPAFYGSTTNNKQRSSPMKGGTLTQNQTKSNANNYQYHMIQNKDEEIHEDGVELKRDQDQDKLEPTTNDDNFQFSTSHPYDGDSERQDSSHTQTIRSYKHSSDIESPFGSPIYNSNNSNNIFTLENSSLQIHPLSVTTAKGESAQKMRRTASPAPRKFKQHFPQDTLIDTSEGEKK